MALNPQTGGDFQVSHRRISDPSLASREERSGERAAHAATLDVNGSVPLVTMTPCVPARRGPARIGDGRRSSLAGPPRQRPGYSVATRRRYERFLKMLMSREGANMRAVFPSRRPWDRWLLVVLAAVALLAQVGTARGRNGIVLFTASVDYTGGMTRSTELTGNSYPNDPCTRTLSPGDLERRDALPGIRRPEQHGGRAAAGWDDVRAVRLQPECRRHDRLGHDVLHLHRRRGHTGSSGRWPT